MNDFSRNVNDSSVQE